MWPGTRTQKLPQRTHPRMAVKGATQSILPESDVGIIPRIIPSIEGSDHTLSNTKISDARPSVREVLEKVSRHELSIRKAHRTIARLWKSSHMQILGSDDPGSLAGTSRFKDQGVQTEPRRSLQLCGTLLRKPTGLSIRNLPTIQGTCLGVDRLTLGMRTRAQISSPRLTKDSGNVICTRPSPTQEILMLALIDSKPGGMEAIST